MRGGGIDWFMLINKHRLLLNQLLLLVIIIDFSSVSLVSYKVSKKYMHKFYLFNRATFWAFNAFLHYFVVNADEAVEVAQKSSRLHLRAYLDYYEKDMKVARFT